MMNALVLRQPDRTAEAWQKKHGYRLVISAGWELPAERALFVADGTAVPYNLLQAGFGLLECWDVAAPLWRYGLLATDIGTAEERRRTEKAVKDLRQLLYAHELLFVRDSEDGRRFLGVWWAECEGKAEPRLAFLRALHIVKPLFCALPRSWLAEETLRARQDAQARLPGERVHQAPKGLVKVEIAPGRYVSCRPGDEERTRLYFGRLAMSRRERKAANVDH